MHQQRWIEWIGGVAPHDARGDQRARIDVGVPQELVAVRMHLHGGAGLELGQRRRGGVDFIAEDPQVAGAQTTVFAALEFQDGDCHGALFYRPMHDPGRMRKNRLAQRNEPVPAAARGQSRGLVSLGQGSASTWRRASGKPILLSIGYSACHWCHVMAHESFEDPATAALMNELFVNIKVDREERPDLDKIYQFAHQVLTQRGGGWPLTMFLTHDDQKPFFGGTYFPDEAALRHARVRHAAQARRGVLPRAARGAARAERHADGCVRRPARPPPVDAGAQLTRAPLDGAREQLARDFRQALRRFRRRARNSRIPARSTA